MYLLHWHVGRQLCEACVPFGIKCACATQYLPQSGQRAPAGLVNAFSRDSVPYCPLSAWRWKEVCLACDWIWGTQSKSREDHDNFFKKYLEVLTRLHVWRNILLTTCFSLEQFIVIEKCPKEKLNTAVGHVIFFSNRHGTFIGIVVKYIPIKMLCPPPVPTA